MDVNMSEMCHSLIERYYHSSPLEVRFCGQMVLHSETKEGAPVRKKAAVNTDDIEERNKVLGAGRLWRLDLNVHARA